MDMKCVFRNMVEKTSIVLCALYAFRDLPVINNVQQNHD